MEVFRDVVGFEKIYKVGDFGSILSNKSGEWIYLKPMKRKNDGYLFVNLCSNSKSIHKLVHILIAESFLNHIPKRYVNVVDHINGDRADCRLKNLRIVTHRDNCTVCFRKNVKKYSSKYIGVSWNSKMKIWISTISINNKSFFIGKYENELDAANAYRQKLSSL